MFQGIIKQLGLLEKRSRRSLVISPEKPWAFAKGESVAIDGVCLTVAGFTKKVCFFDLGEETVKKTTLGRLKSGDWVNIERPLRMGEPISGHIVLGHVDAVGRIQRSQKRNNSVLITLDIPAKDCLVAAKGCLAVDGISLTVNHVHRSNGRLSIDFCLIPETAHRTMLAHKKSGDLVNVESDYLFRLLKLSNVKT